MPTIGGNVDKLVGVFGPFGPRVVGLYVSWCLHWYCIYHANNWRDMCKLLVVCGPLRPRQLNEWDLRNSITDTLEPRAFQRYSTWWGFSSFAVFVYTLYLCICNLYLHDLQLKIWFMTSLYQGLLKNVALNGVYGHFINHCICVYTVFVYLCECICM